MTGSSCDGDHTSDHERVRWDRKYLNSSESDRAPDPFLLRAFDEYISPQFPGAGGALDVAGGAGRHAIWLAKKGWDVTLIDISTTGIEKARQHAGSLATRIHFVINDLTTFKAAQTRFELVMVFFYLERQIFAEIMDAIKPGGLLVYKTFTAEQENFVSGPRKPAHLLQPRELLQLASGLRVLHYQEDATKQATAELVAQKDAYLRESLSI